MKKQQKKTTMPRIVGLLLIIVVIVGAGLFFALRPQHDALTDELIEGKRDALSQGEEDIPLDQKEATGDDSSNDYVQSIKDNLLSGGPPKDGIPAIDEPVYVSASESDLSDDEIVFGISYGELVAAYPKDIMYWHEIVNEEVGDEQLSVTYCPLTGSVIGYKDKNLGVSGQLYNSNLVFYDRATDTIYPQILGVGVDGPSTKEKLATFPVAVTTWGQWKEAHPETKILSRETGYDRDYDRNPYPGYDDALRVWFPLSAESDRFHSKTVVFGIELEGEPIAVVKEKAAQEEKLLIPTSSGTITVTHNPITDTLTAVDESGAFVKGFEVYWFAWYAFHPDTQVIE